jgi:acyl-CoA reductase-like NAD-dependent aldehyde dehydrogenase
VDAAVAAATRAFPKWAKLSGHDRAKYLYALARLLQKHARLFAVLESLDNGKPIREAATSTSPSRSGISTTTRALRNFLQKNSPTQTAGRLRPDHPVELPAPDAGVENRAGARRRETRSS